MEVFGIGPLEIILIVLVAFIVLGPDRIPGTMRQLGIWARQLREAANNITRDYNAEIREITGEITALQEEIRSIQRDLGGIATGFMTMDPPPARSNTATPAEPIGPERSASIVQSLTDDIKRAGASSPAAPAAPSPPAAPASTETDPGNSYEI